MRNLSKHPAAIVIGSNEVGSALAVLLHRAGFAVVVCDGVDASWLRRGMAFTDAWYFGNSSLDGESAVFCSSIKSIPTVLGSGDLIAATTWSWRGVASTLQSPTVIDCRMHKRDAQPVGGAGSERFVYAPKTDRFATGKRIGAAMRAGEVVGALGNTIIRAPITGVLRGLSANGARVEADDEIVEIDPRGDAALCFGLRGRPLAIAQGMLERLAATEHAGTATPSMPTPCIAPA